MGSLGPERYDFIVVGAGPAGSTLAIRLATSAKRPHVLLVEAGGKNDNKDWRIDAERWLHRTQPAMAWGYKTVPQTSLNGQELSYDRGKGLGGSSAINFCSWNIGPQDDHDTIAALVGDDEWKWNTGAHPRYLRIEEFHGQQDDIPPEFRDYFQPKPEDHGKSGVVKVGVAKVWEQSNKVYLDAFGNSGWGINRDIGNGNPLGIGINVCSAHAGKRATAADQLHSASSNLEIVTDVQVARVYFEGSQAKGIESLDGRRFEATHEVILTAGTLNTPAILMHSGIGPASHLEQFQIPVLLDNPNIGQHLRDHCHADPHWRAEILASDRLRYYQSEELQAKARAQWKLDQTGPLAELACTFVMGFLKSDKVIQSQEFKALPKEVRDHLLLPTVPSFEVIANCATVDMFIDPANAQPLVNIFGVLMNTQSVGSCTLQSSDPAMPLSFDPRFLSHPYDRRVAIEVTREILRVMRGEAFSQYNQGIVRGPKSESEEDILAFWRERAVSTWHMSGTVKMGREQGKDGACVDKDFKVYGIERLRVADLSVLPIMVNNHTQTTAYLVGLMAGDKIVHEYGLDKDI